MEVFEENQRKTRRRTKTEENSEVKMERFNPANSESYRTALTRNAVFDLGHLKRVTRSFVKACLEKVARVKLRLRWFRGKSIRKV
jgi:hypothetical protein